MEIFKKPRLALAHSITRRRLKKTYRNKKFNNLRNTHKIGIVWDGSNVKSFNTITSFYQRMMEKNIQVDIICYYSGKVLPDEYTALRYLTCFKRSDLSFFYLPKEDHLNEFIGTPYEILIDINFANRFPLYYITAMSKAEFKLGAGGTSNRNTLDMTLEIKDKSDIGYFIEQVEVYLEMINTGV